jgi:hypothetical protein
VKQAADALAGVEGQARDFAGTMAVGARLATRLIPGCGLSDRGSFCRLGRNIGLFLAGRQWGCGFVGNAVWGVLDFFGHNDFPFCCGLIFLARFK